MNIELLDLSAKGHLGPAVACNLELREGQAVTFVLRIPQNARAPDEAEPTPERARELGVPYDSRFSN